MPAETDRGNAPSPTIEAAKELAVGQTATSITVQHPSTRGTHPKAETHRFGSHGVVGRSGEQARSDVFWFGHQLVIGRSSTYRADADGQRRTVEYSEMWSLDDSGRLVIVFKERQSGATAGTATLTYEKR